MKFRRLRKGERESVLELLEGWPLPDGVRGPGFFCRQFAAGVGLREEDVWVCEESRSLVACALVHRRWLKIMGHSIPAGGLGGVYVRPGFRGRGLAQGLVERAAEAMVEAGCEISIAFARRAELLEGLGWHVWKGQRSILRRGPTRPGRSGGSCDAKNEAEEAIEILPLERRRDRALSAVEAIHSSYSGSRSGTVVRDDALWETSLALGESIGEEFLVARRGGLAVAYARASLLGEVLTVTEFGRFEDGAPALACLLARLLEARPDDPLAPAGKNSEALRSFLMLPTFDDIGLTVSLEQEGIASDPMDDENGLIRCLNLAALAARLDVDLLPGEDGARFLDRILPPDGFVFWPADRF